MKPWDILHIMSATRFKNHILVLETMKKAAH